MGLWTVNIGVASVGYVFGNLLAGQQQCWEMGEDKDYLV